MITILVHRNGLTERASSFDPQWLSKDSGAIVWVDLSAPSPQETLILSDTFRFHPLSVEDARASAHDPKIEAYDGYLYAVLHGINFGVEQRGFGTRDRDFFIGPNYLVTVHDGRSTSIRETQNAIERNGKIMTEGPVALFHRILDALVDRYRPSVDKLEDRIDELEKAIFERPSQSLMRDILSTKLEVSALRRIITPQRDVVARLARREFLDVSQDQSFRFRDVYDHLVRIADDAAMYQDRITGLLEAHLTNVSNHLNEVMKVLTVMSTIFMPLTLMSGLWGMNVPLPRFPGGEAAQFWWVFGVMLFVVVTMLGAFRRKHWI